MRLYETLWRLCIPLLKRNARLKEGFDRRYRADGLEPADIWIHAASAGEAFLALSLVENLKPSVPVHILVTTNTRQGFDIIQKEVETGEKDSRVSVTWDYIPFDRPRLMDQAVLRVFPKLMILLETELWPGLLLALKKQNIKTILINGRMTPKSLKYYMLWPSLWKTLGPDLILAISEDDAHRFAELFGRKKVQTMANIKFDRLKTTVSDTDNPLTSLLAGNTKFLVLGSVRQPEENPVENIIQSVHAQLPETIIGLFPRHMQRIRHWAQALDRLGVSWKLRSGLDREPVPAGTVILWDVFGELNSAYALANAVFVGGSLASLGGQNFLEPMICGITPVIGPSWENFAWAGEKIFNQGLAIRVDTWQSAASELIRALRRTESIHPQKAKAVNYLEAKKGGTDQACHLIEKLLRDTEE